MHAEAMRTFSANALCSRFGMLVGRVWCTGGKAFQRLFSHTTGLHLWVVKSTPAQSLSTGWSEWTCQELCSNFSESPARLIDTGKQSCPVVQENRSEHQHTDWFLFLKIFTFILYAWDFCLCLYMCVPCVCLVPMQTRRGHWISWNWITNGCKPPCGWQNRACVFCRRSKHSQLLGTSPDPRVLLAK